MEVVWCVLVPMTVLIGVVVMMNVAANNRLKEREQSKRAYHASLNELKKQPTNPDLKQKTLYLGRSYSNLTRGKTGVALFDEVALSNDINAATAAAPHAASQITQRATVAERLKHLDDLKVQGLINDQEHVARRQQILADI